MASALFAGASAQSTVDTLTKWRELFLEEERIEATKDIARQDRESRERIAQQGFDSSEALAILNNKAALERMTKQERYGFVGGLMSQAFQGNLDMAAIPQLQGALEQWDMPEFLPLLKSAVPNLIKPQDSLAFSQQLAEAMVNPEAAAALDVTFSDVHFERLANANNWTTEERQAQKKAWDERVQHALENREVAASAAQQQLDLGLQTLEAELAGTRAETERTQAQTGLIGAQTTMTEEEIQHFRDTAPMLVQDLQNRVTEGTIRLEHLPALMEAEVQTAIANADSATTQAEILNSTKEYLIAQEDARLQGMYANNEISRADLKQRQSDYRVSLATEGARIALAENNVELAEKQIEDLVATTEQRYADILATEADVALANQRVENLALEAQISVNSLLSDLVARGDTEQIASLGPELLQAAGFSRETANGIISNVQERATDNWTHAQTMRALNMEMATAERDLARFQADTAQERWDFEKWTAREGFRLEEQRVLAYANSIANQVGANGTGLDPNLTVEDALSQASGGMTGNQFTDLVNELNDITSTLEDPTQEVIREAIEAQSKGRYDSLRGIVAAYGQIMGAARGITKEVLKANPERALELIPPQLQGTDIGDLILQDLGWVSVPGNGDNSDDPGRVVDMTQNGAVEALGASASISGFDADDSEDMMIVADMNWADLPSDENGKYVLDQQGNKRYYSNVTEFQADVRDAAVRQNQATQAMQSAAQVLTDTALNLGYTRDNFDPMDFEDRSLLFQRLTQREQTLTRVISAINQAFESGQVNPVSGDIPQSVIDVVRSSGLGDTYANAPTIYSLQTAVEAMHGQIADARDAYSILNRQGR